MIAPMKKYSFLVFHREYEDFLLKLRELGMVHIVEREGGVTEEVSRQLQEASQLNRLIRSLESRGLPADSAGIDASPEELFAEINEILHQQTVLNQQLAQIRKETAEVMPWGDFSEDLIKRLGDAGVKIRLFMASQRTWSPELYAGYDIFEVNRLAGIVYFALIDTGNPLPSMDAEEVKIPGHSLSGLEQRRQEIASVLASHDARLDEIAASGTDILKGYRNKLLQDAELEKAFGNAVPEAEDKLRILEGWIPAESSEVLNRFLDQEDIFYLQESPVPGDSVPILLKNKGFASKFEVLGELYSLPSYKELDLTPFFAPFYTIFFGFCLGDAGYGLLMILATIFAKRKVAASMKPIVSLVTYLGIATLVFGFISGTFFGINLYESGLPGYRNLQAMFVANDTNINDVLFALSLILGGIQIVFGMVLRAVNENIQFGFKYALGTIGWIILLVGLAVVYGISSFTGVPVAELKPWLYAVLVAGGVLVLFLNSPGKSIFMNFGLGLWNSYNMVTGVLGDLLSYIRLFALGISSAILGFVFNSLAMSVGTSIVGIFFMVIILVIGHSINLFMAGLGSFVHPMRLTFVEFYKNSGFAGGGRKYQPFRKLT